MGYPFILQYKDVPFARINHDWTWSVKWDKAIDVAFTEMDLYNRAIVGFTKILVAARDNFFPTPWEISDKWSNQWERSSKVLDVRKDSDGIPEEGQEQYPVLENHEKIARINYDGTWSIKWDRVLDIAKIKKPTWIKEPNGYQKIAICGFCDLMLAAQYNFPVVPWDRVVVEEDD